MVSQRNGALRMIKIFMCIPSLASAGAERFVTELACNLDRTKYEPIVVVTNILSQGSSFYQKLLQEKISIYDVSDKNYFCEVSNMIRLLRKEKPDIIHSNVGALLHVLLPVVLYGKCRAHLFTVHSMGYRIFSGMKKRLVSFCFRRRKVIPVAISDTVRQSVVDAYKIPKDNIELVYNGVDTQHFNCVERLLKSTVTIITTGTLYHIKNHELLIDAFEKAQQKLPNLRLVIVGDGKLRNNLEDKVNELELQDKVLFAGNQRDVCKFLNEADIYCCTSKVEGLPIAVLEAMACGLPIITTPAGGVVDIVQEEENGFIVNYDAECISKKMVELASDEALRHEMGNASRSIALKREIGRAHV